MDTESIEREVRRLAPWYYLLNLGGVRTDITPPNDPSGHRVISCPPILDGFWQGKSVLDVGCNEAAWSFGALDRGAAHVDAFDCREINLEKARFVAGVLGHENVDFYLENTDSWIAKYGDRIYDIVLMCGIICHLPDPSRTIREICEVARDWVFVTCGVYGGEADGYTRYSETDSIAASNQGLDSLIPNTTNTLIQEYVQHGFRPIHIEETRAGTFNGGCCLALKNAGRWSGCRQETVDSAEPNSFDLQLVPDDVEQPHGRADAFDLFVAVFNHSPRAREVDGRLRIQRADGTVLQEQSQRITLSACPRSPDDPPTTSFHQRAELDLDGAGPEATVTLELADADGRVVGASRLVISRDT